MTFYMQSEACIIDLNYDKEIAQWQDKMYGEKLGLQYLNMISLCPNTMIESNLSSFKLK